MIQRREAPSRLHTTSQEAPKRIWCSGSTAMGSRALLLIVGRNLHLDLATALAGHIQKLRSWQGKNSARTAKQGRKGKCTRAKAPSNPVTESEIMQASS